MTQDTPPLSELVPLPDYQEQHPTLFPSAGSITWYVRQHRTELVKEGALVLHAGRWFVVPEPFGACVMKEGKRAAQARQALAAGQA